MFDLLMMQSARRANPLKFSADLTSTAKVLTPDKGIGPATFTGGGQWIPDHEGVLRFVDAGNPAIPGSRVVRNLAPSSAQINVATGTTVIGSFVSETATTEVHAVSIGGAIPYASLASFSLATQVKVLAQGGRNDIQVMHYPSQKGVQVNLLTGASAAVGGATNVSAILQQDGFWLIKFNSDNSTGDNSLRIYGDSGGGLSYAGDTAKGFYVKDVQIENVTGQSVQLPSEYIATTFAPVAKCFDTLLNSTPIAGIKGVLLEPGSTNKVTGYSVIPADTLGAEKVANGSFATDTSWTKDAGWTISSGTAVATAVANGLGVSQDATLVKGRIYRITFTITAMTSGGITPYAGNLAGTNRTAIGAYTEDIIAGTNGRAGFYANGATSATIDNVSVKEVIFAVGTIATAASTGAVLGMALSGDAAATLSVVDDTAALATAGLQNICASGKVYKLDNSAGVGTASVVAFSGSTGNTNPHAISIYCRTTGAVSGAIFALGGGGAAGDVALPAISGAYTRKTATGTPSAGSNTLNIYNVPAGGSAYFILPQLEELPFATSPIITAGATATRAATVLTYPPANWQGNNIAFSIEAVTNKAILANTYPMVFEVGTSAQDNVQVFFNHNAMGLERYISNAVSTSSKALVPVVGTTYKIGARLSKTTGVAIFVNGNKGESSTAITTDLVAAGPIRLGSYFNGTFPLNGQLKNLRIWWEDASDAKMIVRTT